VHVSALSQHSTHYEQVCSLGHVMKHILIEARITAISQVIRMPDWHVDVNAQGQHQVNNSNAICIDYW